MNNLPIKLPRTRVDTSTVLAQTSGTSLSAATPQYILLMDGGRADGPTCLDKRGEPCSAIYGFANRSSYEAFIAKRREPRRPYPLVNRYLTRLLAETGRLIIVLDATGPDEELLQATTAEAVISAHASSAARMMACCELTRSANGGGYTLSMETSDDSTPWAPSQTPH